MSASSISSATSSEPAVQVVSSTWERDCHGLFDFEAQDFRLQQVNCIVENNVVCVRSGPDVQVLSERSTTKRREAGVERLLQVTRSGDQFWIKKASSRCQTSSHRTPWLVVRDLPTGSHPLQEGDHLKLGRCKLKVRQIVLDENSDARPQLMFAQEPTECLADFQSMEAPCRICLLEGHMEDDPLIAPCACKGSMACVHLGCVRQWINTRASLAESATGSYTIKPKHSTCDLCKQGYADYVCRGSKKEPLAELPGTLAPFIVLEEELSQEKGVSAVHVLSLANQKTLKMGRSHDSDVCVNDVSLSRWHASIRLHEGQVLLEDHGSKFGTCVLLREPRALEGGSQVSVQVGRTILRLTPCPTAEAAAAPEAEGTE